MSPIKTTEEWLEIFEACRLSGLSVRRWCKENQFSENAYRYWYHKLSKDQNENAVQTIFAEIPVPLKVFCRYQVLIRFAFIIKGFRLIWILLMP